MTLEELAEALHEQDISCLPKGYHHSKLDWNADRQRALREACALEGELGLLSSEFVKNGQEENLLLAIEAESLENLLAKADDSDTCGI